MNRRISRNAVGLHGNEHFGAAFCAKFRPCASASVPVVNANYILQDTTLNHFYRPSQRVPGSDINLHTNAGVQAFFIQQSLLLAAVMHRKTDTSRYYYGKLRLQFSRPVD